MSLVEIDMVRLFVDLLFLVVLMLKMSIVRVIPMLICMQCMRILMEIFQNFRI
jgi:hypothetical protein